MTRVNRRSPGSTVRKDNRTMNLRDAFDDRNKLDTAEILAIAAEEAGDTEGATYWRGQLDGRNYDQLPPGVTPEQAQRWAAGGSLTAEQLASPAVLFGVAMGKALTELMAKRPWATPTEPPTEAPVNDDARKDARAASFERHERALHEHTDKQWRETLRNGKKLDN